MKRILIAFLSVVILLIACIYIFIPATITISSTTYLSCTSEATYRFLSNTANLAKLSGAGSGLKGKEATDSNSFVYKDVRYQVVKKLPTSFDILIKSSDFSEASSLLVVPTAHDSSGIEWQSEFATGLNPLNKLRQYSKALSLKQSMTGLLTKLSSYLDKQENVYGLKIEKSSTQDTFLLATKQVLKEYPGTEAIYNSVHLLRENILKHGVAQTGVPLMNVTELGANQYQLMVALPTNKPIPDEGSVFFRRMVPGNFLTAEVKGGSSSVINALQIIKQYSTDYKKTNMAIPFAALITDRSKEPDTTKWVTKVYYPVAN